MSRLGKHRIAAGIGVGCAIAAVGCAAILGITDGKPYPDADAADDGGGGGDAALDVLQMKDALVIDGNFANCDGQARTNDPTAVHVHPTGSDLANCGSTGNPCRTIGFAIGRATMSNAKAIYIGDGTYKEFIDVGTTLTVEGGWAADGGVWTPSCTTELAHVDSTKNYGVLVVNGATATLRLLTVSSKPNGAPGESVYGMFVQNGNAVVDNVVLVAQNAGDGVGGPAGSTPTPFACNQVTGDTGEAGAPGVGVVNMNGYFGLQAAQGKTGPKGTGGGNGTMGACGTCATCSVSFDGGGSCVGDSGTECGGPGGAGCGGPGGTGGFGGYGGGAAIALFAYGGTITISGGGLLVTATGGNGGAGGVGGDGGPGVGGSQGNDYNTCASQCGVYPMCTSNPTMLPGGDGGAPGSPGFRGGQGGGGAGGPTYLVYRANNAMVTATFGQGGTKTMLGSPGNGGAPNGTAGEALSTKP